MGDSVRLLEDDTEKGCSRSIVNRDTRRPATTDGAHKRSQNESATREAIASSIYRANQGIAIDSYTYVKVLQGCLKLKDLELVKEVHNCIEKSGLEQNTFVVNNLLKCYINCGRIEIAQELFSRVLNKDIISWTIMIGGYAEHDRAEDAIEVYKRMRSEGEHPNAITYLTALKACVSPIALKWGKRIHVHIKQDGYLTDVRVSNALVSMYAKCGSVGDARMVFDSMVERDVISWNAMIGGLALCGHGHEALSLFHRMRKERITPNSNTYLSILNAATGPENLAWVKGIHSCMTKSRLGHDLSVSNALIHAYGKCGRMDRAKSIFDSMVNHDVISWSAMIGGLALNGRGEEAIYFFRQMQRKEYPPNAATYLSILNSNASERALAWVKEVHSHAVKSGLIADVRVANALVNMYAKCGHIEDARAVFDGIEVRSVSTWTAMIGGLAQHSLGREAYSLFLQMQREGFKPNPTTYVSILNPCSSAGALKWVKEVHTHAMEAGLDVDLRVGNALIHMYAKIGEISEARQVFDNMMDRDVFSWTVMIGGLAQHAHGGEALQLFDEMKSKGVKPDGALFLAVLSACSHTGLIDEARVHFRSMTRDYGIEPVLVHYTCMVDMLGRAGLLMEAKRFILNMPIKPDGVIWTVFLNACRSIKNVELAELAVTECLKLEQEQ